MTETQDVPGDGPDALFAWARRRTPCLADAWDELSLEWQPETPTDTDVILFVLAPGLVKAVREGDETAVGEVSAMLEAMATYDHFMWNQVAVTAAPALADQIEESEVDLLLRVLGPVTRSLVEEELALRR